MRGIYLLFEKVLCIYTSCSYSLSSEQCNVALDKYVIAFVFPWYPPWASNFLLIIPGWCWYTTTSQANVLVASSNILKMRSNFHFCVWPHSSYVVILVLWKSQSAVSFKGVPISIIKLITLWYPNRSFENSRGSWKAENWNLLIIKRFFVQKQQISMLLCHSNLV